MEGGSEKDLKEHVCIFYFVTVSGVSSMLEAESRGVTEVASVFGHTCRKASTEDHVAQRPGTSA